MNTPFMLEYLPGTEKHPRVTLHNNIFFDGRFDSELESNGWRSLALFPEEAVGNAAFHNLCDIIREQNLSYEDARALAQAIAHSFKSHTL